MLNRFLLPARPVDELVDVQQDDLLTSLAEGTLGRAVYFAIIERCSYAVSMAIALLVESFPTGCIVTGLCCLYFCLFLVSIYFYFSDVYAIIAFLFPAPLSSLPLVGHFPAGCVQALG